MSYRLPAAAAVVVLALQGCAPQPPPPPVAIDTLDEGIAKTCTFSPAQPKPGGTVEATITMTNDGWCAYRATETKGQAYMLGLVKQRPEHGELQIRKWNGETRVEYNPNAGFTGADKFSVALRATAGGADAAVQISATVTQGAGMPAPAAEEEKPAPTRRARPAARSTKKPTT